MAKKQASMFPVTESDLETLALSQFRCGKYKEASELYKKLLQGAENHAWRQQLADCYLQRALAFAEKRQYKDALVLWENYSRHVSPPYQYYDRYITWLILAKNPAATRTCLQQLSARQLDKEYPALAALLGLLIITEHPEFRPALPQDSAFTAHLQIVQQVLHSYRENDLGGLDAALKHLPYRSAFRDVRTLLKAAGRAPASLAETRSLLANIPAESPYAQAAALLHACTLKGSELADATAKFNDRQRRLIGEIIGLDFRQLDLLNQLGKQKRPLSDKTKFNLAIQFRALCGERMAQNYCFAMLTRYPAGLPDFNKSFTVLGVFEENRLKALRHEGNGNSYEAEYYWKQCIKSLSKAGAGNGMQIALILRHMAIRIEDPKEQSRLLGESLEHDPEDRDSYLQILRNCGRQAEAADDYRQWLAKTLDWFPEDVEILTLAAQNALRSKAHTKAEEYAAKILTVDPLNTFAKQTLFSCRLAMARWLIQGKKFHLVEKQLERAEGLKIGKNYALQTQLMRGLCRFAAQDKAHGLQLIVDALHKLHSDPVNMHFQAAMEALSAGLPVTTVLKNLPPAKDHVLSPRELTHFTQQLTSYIQEDGRPERLHKALEKVKAPLKKSILQHNFDENLLLTLCQELDAIKHFELLRHVSKSSQSRWHKPIWMYYRIYSETNGDPEQCSYLHSFRLHDSLELARQQKDHRTAVLISNYLDRYHGGHPSAGRGFSETLHNQGRQNAYEDPMDELFGDLPDEVFKKLDKKIASLTKKTSPERLVRELANKTVPDSKILRAMMQNADLYTALIILKAAKSLGMDIDVGVEDVLACFKV